VDGRRVKIERPYRLRDTKTGEELLGEYDNERHVIRVKRMRRELAWSVFFHEETHMHLGDLGVTNVLGEDLEDAVCDAIATARMADMVRMLEAQDD
jgi:hypothetical protein